MRFNYIFLLLSILSCNHSYAQNVVQGKVTPGFFSSQNLVVNPNCQKNAYSITAASVSMTANTTSAPLDGVSDCRWDPTATAQEISWAVNTLPSGLKGQNCEARLTYRGDASLVSFFVRNSSGPVASGISLTNADQNGATASINYPCADGTAVPVLRSTGNAASAQYFIYAGAATNLGSSNVSTPFVSYASSAGLSGLGTGSATVNYAEWARSGPMMLIRFRITKDGSGGSGSTALAISVPSGITISTRHTANYFGGSAGSGVTTNGNFELYYDTSAHNIKFLQNDATNFVGSEFSSGASVGGFISFPVNGWEASGTTANPSLPILPTKQRLISGTTYTTPVGATHLVVKACGSGGGGGGGGTSLQAGSNGTNTTFSGGGVSLTAGFGSGGPGGIGLGGAGGSVTITGVADAISMPGSYGQAGSGVGTSVTYVTGGSGGNSPLFAGGGGGGMSSTIGNPGTANSGGGGAGGGATNAASAYAGNGGGSGGCLEAIIKNPTTSYTISVGSGGNGGSAAASGAAGGRGADGVLDITEYYQGMNAPVLIGGFTSASVNALREEVANITLASTCTLATDVEQFGSDWITSCTRNAAGKVTLGIKTGYFSKISCQITVGRNLENTRYTVSPWISSISTTSLTIQWSADDDQQASIASAIANADDSGTFYISCKGIR